MIERQAGKELWSLRRKASLKQEKEKIFRIEELTEAVRKDFQGILRENPYHPGMRQEELRRRIEKKKNLRMALRQSVYGEQASRLFLKDYIRELLLTRYGMDEEKIKKLLPLERPDQLENEYTFLALLYHYQRNYGRNGLEQFLLDCDVGEDGHITEERYRKIYESKVPCSFRFYEKMEILSQIIFQNYRGFGVIDELRQFAIDGISAGVSGTGREEIKNGASAQEFWLGQKEKERQKIWLFFHGRSLCLDFLYFRNQREFIRVCRNIYRYQNPGQLSQERGYIVNEMEDGARVSVCRPPFSEEWAFFIRKFDTMERKELGELFTDPGHEFLEKLLIWLVKGCQVTGITGEQGAGKTTLLMTLAGYIPKGFNLRVQELSFELHLRSLYPERNILSFRETETVSGQEGLDFQKKTDGTVHILGEVASLEVSAWLVQMSQAASRFTLFTHHARTADTLVASLRNALLQKGGFHNERAAGIQVVETVHFDVHMAKNEKGHRYVERITELIPGEGNRALYEAKDILVYQDGHYQRQNCLSARAVREIERELSLEERQDFKEQMGEWKKREE